MGPDEDVAIGLLQFGDYVVRIVNLELIKAVWRAFNEDKVLRLASSVAYSAIFSLAPLLIVLIAVSGWVLSARNGGYAHDVVEDALLGHVGKAAGSGTADLVRQLIADTLGTPRQGFFAQTFGGIALLFGAAALFSTLQDALNAIWQVEAVRGGWKRLGRNRVVAFAMVLVFGLLLLATFAASAAIAFIDTHATWIPPGAYPIILTASNGLVTLLLASVAFASIYKVLPDVGIGWRDVWLGGAVTAVLFVVGESLIAVYFAVAGVTSAYGAAGAFLVALLWIYYSAAVLLLGAEFTKIIAKRAETSAPTAVRLLSEQPAGIDPRKVGKPPKA